MLEKLGLVGWRQIEIGILACMASGMSICFKGGQGEAKTLASRLLSMAALGSQTRDRITGETVTPLFRAFNCATTNFDELLGIISPSALKKDELKYLNTGGSVWEIHAALFDEINRVNPLIGSKFMEVILDGTVNGRQTALRYVFSAINPPGNKGYNSQYMDLAQASRFSFIEVPSAWELADNGDMNTLFNVVSSGGSEAVQGEGFPMKKLLSSTRKEVKTFKKRQQKHIWNFIVKVAAVLNKKDNQGNRPVNFSTRQMVQLWKMTMAFVALEKLEAGLESGDEAHVNMIVSMVPEMNDVVQGIKIDSLSLRQQLAELVNNEFQGSDPIAKAKTLVDLAQVTASDEMAYIAEFTLRTEKEKSTDQLKGAHKAMRKSTLAGAVTDACMKAIKEKLISLSLQEICGPEPVTAESLRMVTTDVENSL